MGSEKLSQYYTCTGRGERSKCTLGIDTTAPKAQRQESLAWVQMQRAGCQGTNEWFPGEDLQVRLMDGTPCQVQGRPNGASAGEWHG